MSLLDQITYKTKYFKSSEELIEKIINKTVVPYQLEVQPGRIKGKKICWMPCSYCYGGSSENDGQRLDPERYLDIIDQTNNGDYFDFYKKEDFLDIIWMFCVEIFIAPLIIASPIPYFFSRGKKSTISYSWYR